MGMLPGAVEVLLEYPIEVDGAALNTLTIRRPKAGDQLTLAENAESPRAEAQLLADLSEQTLQTIEALDFTDYWTLKETYKGFLPKALLSMLENSDT